MPQPAITGVPPVAKFGSLPLPNGQGTMTQVNLNDLVNWFWQDYKGDDDYLQRSVGQLAWRGRGVVIARDKGSRVLTLPMRYLETGTGGFGAAKAVLTEAGPQQLTFDNSTCIVAEVQAIKNEVFLKRYTPYQWSCELEFLCPDPSFKDVASTTSPNAQALSSGSATTFNVTYAGSVWCEPVWTLTIPAGSTAPIASFTLSNTMSLETLTVPFPGNLAGSTAHTIVIDSAAMSITRSQNGATYDNTGNAFPCLYGPAGQVNAMSATLTPASGTATSCTLTGTFYPRWLI